MESRRRLFQLAFTRRCRSFRFHFRPRPQHNLLGHATLSVVVWAITDTRALTMCRGSITSVIVCHVLPGSWRTSQSQLVRASHPHASTCTQRAPDTTHNELTTSGHVRPRVVQASRDPVPFRLLVERAGQHLGTVQPRVVSRRSQPLGVAHSAIPRKLPRHADIVHAAQRASQQLTTQIGINYASSVGERAAASSQLCPASPARPFDPLHRKRNSLGIRIQARLQILVKNSSAKTMTDTFTNPIDSAASRLRQ
jgi:hypothetical protein